MYFTTKVKKIKIKLKSTQKSGESARVNKPNKGGKECGGTLRTSSPETPAFPQLKYWVCSFCAKCQGAAFHFLCVVHSRSLCAFSVLSDVLVFTLSHCTISYRTRKKFLAKKNAV